MISFFYTLFLNPCNGPSRNCKESKERNVYHGRSQKGKESATVARGNAKSKESETEE